MIYITDGEVAYHQAVSPREVNGTATCAERSLGKAVVQIILREGVFSSSSYGHTYRPLLTPEALTAWQAELVKEQEYPGYAPRFHDDGLNQGTVCAYCHGKLDEEPLPDDYPISPGEVPNSPLVAVRWRLQKERDEREKEGENR